MKQGDYTQLLMNFRLCIECSITSFLMMVLAMPAKEKT